MTDTSQLDEKINAAQDLLESELLEWAPDNGVSEYLIYNLYVEIYDNLIEWLPDGERPAYLFDEGADDEKAFDASDGLWAALVAAA